MVSIALAKSRSHNTVDLFHR